MYSFEKCLITQTIIVVFLQLFGCVWLFATIWAAAHHASLSFTISSCPQLFPASGPLPMSRHLPSGGQSIGASVSVSTLVLPIFRVDFLSFFFFKFYFIFKLYITVLVLPRVDFLKDWLIWYPCSPRDSQDSSPAWQFESFNSSVLSLLYSPTLTSIPDYWKKP